MRAYNQPVNWWGWHWEPSIPLSIVEIIKAGSMSAQLAALFWIGMERGASLIIAADPPSSGKTATLTALLEFLPPQAGVYFTRGIGETFNLPPPAEARLTYLLVNEISDHLPVYTWGNYARRAFQLMAEGYSLGSTMHADTSQEVVQILEEDLGIPRAHIAHLAFIATIHLSQRAGRLLRRVNELAFLQPDGGEGLEMARIASWNAEDDSFRVLESPEQLASLAQWAGLEPPAFSQEMARRQAFLEDLLRRSITAIPQVEEAIASYGQQREKGSRPSPQGFSPAQ